MILLIGHLIIKAYFKRLDDDLGIFETKYTLAEKYLELVRHQRVVRDFTPEILMEHKNNHTIYSLWLALLDGRSTTDIRAP